MKPADKRLFKSLMSQVNNLHMCWQVYRQLYAKSQKRIDLLNENGSLVFRIFYEILFDEIILAFCRLTDPVKSAGKPTHSLARLIARIDSRTHQSLKQELNDLLTELQNKSEPFRARRNKTIAHSDLGWTLKFSKNPPRGISRADVEAALTVLRTLMNTYEGVFLQGETAYEMLTLPLSADGDFLVKQLKRAVAFRELEKAGTVERRTLNEGRYADA